jgi:hypothetical protein
MKSQRFNIYLPMAAMILTGACQTAVAQNRYLQGAMYGNDTDTAFTNTTNGPAVGTGVGTMSVNSHSPRDYGEPRPLAQGLLIGSPPMETASIRHLPDRLNWRLRPVSSASRKFTPLLVARADSRRPRGALSWSAWQAG